MKKALVIGIDKYPTAPLNGCVNDATRLAKLLRLPTSEFEVKTLVDANATRAQVRREIEWCLASADFSIVYFAGHGVRTSVSTFLATYDYEEGDEGIDFSWLRAAVSRIATSTQACLIILDCCHSGDATVRSLELRAAGIKVSDLSAISGVGKALVAACKGEQTAGEEEINGENFGLFTHHFCDALEGFAANESGLVTVTACYDYVVTKLGAIGFQIPVFKGDLEGHFVLATGVTKRGGWLPVTGKHLLSPSEAITKAENLLSLALEKSQPQSHADWQSRGYKEACQAFEPVLTWFQRRVEDQPNLRTNPGFREKYESCQQHFKNLSNVMPGTKIPQGQIGFSLGAGTFGTVFKIEENSYTTPMCFKAYHAHDLFDSQKVGRFRRGYAAMKQLDHPKIVKVLDLSEIPFGFFMDYIEGANSRQFNPGSTQEPETIINLLLEVAETLQHAHGRGVIHRDVKPENILIKISPDGTPSAYLTDFDLSWFSSATQVTKLAEGFGSHFYAAPEQINNPSSSVAHRATVDTYSFGQLCFFFVTGRDPQAYTVDGNGKTLEQELSRKWTDSTAATEMLLLYKDCTHQSPDKRIAEFREICERIAKISLVMESPNSVYDTPTFIGQVRFTLSGEVQGSPPNANYTSFRSRSGRTEVSIRAIKDASHTIGIDVTFRPDDIVMEGRTSQDARTKVNSRVDSLLQSYKHLDAKRSGAKTGAFEITVRIDHLKKERNGVVTAREVIAKVIDHIEHT